MTTPTAPREPASRLAALLEQYAADLQAGRTPDRDKLLKDNADLAAELEPCLSGLEFIHRARQPGAPAHLGDFRIVREVGRGGMGVVYEAEQESLKRRVALKVLRFGVTPDPEALERFRREAETVAGLHHTNIVPIFFVGSDHGVHYFAMQFIEGRSLADVLATQGRQPAAAAARWGLQAAEALAHAHARGVIHRDVKPSNLLLDAEGIVWLTDFGLARRADEATLTAAGAILGTPRYMSPEQVLAAQRPVDHRSDVYSLGATLYELATGRPVFQAEAPHDLMLQIVETEPAAPRALCRDVPRDLETVLLKCLAKQPEQRYATARDLADDLRRLTTGDPIRARRPSAWSRLRRWAGKQGRGVRAAVVTLVVAAFLVGGAVLAWLAHRDSRLGHVSFTTPPGVSGRAELRDAAGELVLPAFRVPTEVPLAVAGGWYTLRVEVHGQLSENYQILVEQGRKRSFPVASNAEPRYKPVPYKGTVTPWTRGFLEILRENTGQFDANNHEILRTAVRFHRPGSPHMGWEISLRSRPRGLGNLTTDEWKALVSAFPSSPGAAQRLLPGVFLRKEGQEPDLVCMLEAPDGLCALLALSGADGSVLWCSRHDAGGLVFKLADYRPNFLNGGWLPAHQLASLAVATCVTPPDPFAPALVPALYPTLLGVPATQFACPPLLCNDLDGRGQKGFLVALWTLDSPCDARTWGTWRPTWSEPRRYWIEAISATTGQLLWRHDAGTQANFGVLLDKEQSYPRQALQAQMLALGAGPGAAPLALPLLLDAALGGSPQALDRGAAKAWKPPALLETGGSVADRLAFSIQVEETAFPRANLRLATMGGRPVLLAGLYKQLWRLDLTTGKPLAPVVSLPGPVQAWSADSQKALVVTPRLVPPGDLKDGSVVCVATASGKPLWASGSDPRPGQVEFIDLDGDGVPECVTPRWIVGGATGKWRQLWSSGNWHGESLVVGPDLDGDGCRDLFRAGRFAAERYGYPAGTYVQQVEARSGADGHAFWRRLLPFPDDCKSSQCTMFYWQGSPGGPAWLVVGLYPMGDPWLGLAGRHSYLIDPGTGAVEHVWPGVTAVGVMDGGALYATDGKSIFTVPPMAQELWRRPGLWRAQVLEANDGRYSRFYLQPPLPEGDLDGDGVADVIVFQPSGTADTDPVLQAYSGRTGRPLWQAALLEPKDNVATSQWWCAALLCRDFNGDGRPEVVFQGKFRDANGSSRTVLAVLDGRTGKVLWQKPDRFLTHDLARFKGKQRPALVVYAHADAPGQRGSPRQALDGLTGEVVASWDGENTRPPDNIELEYLWDPEGPARPGATTWQRIDHPRQESGGVDLSICRVHSKDNKAPPRVYDFSGIDPRLPVPLPWFPMADPRRVPGLALALAYLALVLACLFKRRWRSAVALLVLLAVLPLIGYPSIDMPGLFDGLAELTGDERRDWTGWYWLWPYRLTIYRGWAVLGNPWTWVVAAGVVAAFRGWRRRGKATLSGPA
jgi:hypothetical protein